MRLSQLAHLLSVSAVLAGILLLIAQSWEPSQATLGLQFGGLVAGVVSATYLDLRSRCRSLNGIAFVLSVLGLAAMSWTIQLIATNDSVPFGRYWDTREASTILLLLVGTLVSMGAGSYFLHTRTVWRRRPASRRLKAV